MEWDIPQEKIFHAITDNASNMICAFKEQATVLTEEQSGMVMILRIWKKVAMKMTMMMKKNAQHQLKLKSIRGSRTVV